MQLWFASLLFSEEKENVVVNESSLGKQRKILRFCEFCGEQCRSLNRKEEGSIKRRDTTEGVAG